jgi:molybdate transport system substrate-binding protein
VPLAYTIPLRPFIVCILALAIPPGAPSQSVASIEQYRHHPPAILHIAAAADLQPVLPTLAQTYEKETGIKLELSFGSSSALATQILNGAPVDVFLGADFSFPEKIVAAGLADQSTPIPYATGTLVLWARKDANIPILNIDHLTDPTIIRIAIADQFRAPYGRAAFATLDALKLTDKLRPKLVHAENVAQAAQFAESGNAQVAFISLTIATSQHMRQVGTYTRVPALYPKIRQCGVVVKASPNLSEAQKFLAWLTSRKTQQSLASFGLEPAQ